jgi:hypothetical protein
LALSNYDELQTTLIKWLNRETDADIVSVVPDFITLAEGQMTRRFVAAYRKGESYPRRIMQRTDASINSGDEYVEVPPDFHGPIDFVLQTSPETVLEYLEPVNLQQWKQADPYNGQAPVYYTVVGCQFQLYPPADQDYTAELTYLKRFPAISADNETNWILTDYPDAYLYGALLQSAPYLKDDGRMAMWAELFTAAIEDICNADPMPGDKSTLRTEIPVLQRWGASGRYNINTDVP